MASSSSRTALFKLLLPALTLLAAVAALEASARVGLSLHLLADDPPMVTVLPPGTDDWRLAHITADRHRRPDPLLWWRPVAAPPYNRQGFKGPEVAIPKPPGAFRVVAYGDSNTDGPPAGDWPGDLGRLLAETGGPAGGERFEVINAGVAGYTSHQGLLRFGEDVGRLQPDVVLVCFGWNDPARVAVPDDAFHPPPAPVVALERWALRLRFVRVALHYAHHRKAPPDAPLVPRVRLADYVANLRRFVEVGRQNGATVVLLTRPHRESETELAALKPQWMSRVPAYNDAVRRLGRKGIPVLDVQRAFAALPREIFADECHFTPEGHETMARLVRDELAQRGLLELKAPSPGG